jgi:glyoxylase-like metal-dependent hydrolase (beta-lactamase superfamily II)
VTGAWREVGDRVFVRRYSEWHGEAFDQNAGVVLGADGALVVDTRGSHRLADALIAELRELTRLPIAAAVNTHHHWDHSWGNARFLPAPIWGHVRCGPRMLERSAEARDQVVAAWPPLSEELTEVVVTPPSNTIEESGFVDLGDRQVELRYLGLGHTDNDILAIVPDASVLFAGDLLEDDAPPSVGDSYPIAWAATVARIVPMANGAVVPGHGTVGGLSFVERQVGEFALLAELGRDAVAGLIGPEEAIRRSPFPAEVTTTGIERIRLELAED